MSPTSNVIAISTDGRLGLQSWRWQDLETFHETTARLFVRVLSSGNAEPFGTSGYLFPVVDCPEVYDDIDDLKVERQREAAESFYADMRDGVQ